MLLRNPSDFQDLEIEINIIKYSLVNLEASMNIE